MKPNKYMIKKPATPEYVLRVLSDSHRQQCQYDPEAEADISLTFDTTIDEWRKACDLVGWRRLGQSLNQTCEMNCSDEEWRSILEPAKKKKLKGVCELIAVHTSEPEICPAKLLGSSCTSAGVFLSIRSLLHEAGADVNSIRPSTPLAWYTRRYTEVFLGSVSCLAPGKLPPVRIHKPIYYVTLLSFIGGCLLMILSGFAHPWLSLVGIFIAAVSYIANWIVAIYLLPTRVEFGDLRTFRHLVNAIIDKTRT